MSKEPVKEPINLDEILSEMKPFGTYQRRTFALILVPIFFAAMKNGQYIWVADDVEYRCYVPQCEKDPPQWDTTGWGDFALVDKCHRRVALVGPCDPAFFTDRTEACTLWVYKSNHTIVAEYNLACQSWKRTMVGSMHCMGMFIALPLTGLVSDRFGRRAALIFTSVSNVPVAIARSFAPSYIIYILLEFFESVVASGVYSTAYVLALEMVRADKRVICGNVIPMFYAGGQMALATLAYVVPYWRTMLRFLYSPTIVLILYYLILSESVRWLLAKGRNREALQIVFKAARMDDITFSQRTMERFGSLLDTPLRESDMTFTGPDHKKPSLLKQVVHSRILMSRLIVCSFWWVTITFVYYGLSINSVALGGSRHLNYIFVSVAELPGYVLGMFTLDRFGRKTSIMVAFFVCGACLLMMPIFPNVLLMTRGLSLVAKMCISMTFSSIYIYTMELFPTQARQSLVSVCSMIGRIGSTLAPQTPLLMEMWKSLPYIIFGAMASVAAMLMFLTPETLNMPLPDTVKQAENLALAPRARRQTEVI